jgi:hypothetical protein
MSIYQDKTLNILDTQTRYSFVCVRLNIFSVGAQNTEKRLLEIFLHILGNLEGNGVFFEEISSYLYEKNKIRDFFICSN